MIARVKIAPVERWCEQVRDAISRHSWDAIESVGLEIGIDTASMETSTIGCGGRMWQVVVPEGWECVDINTGAPGNQGKLCEHFLEMD